MDKLISISNMESDEDFKADGKESIYVLISSY